MPEMIDVTVCVNRPRRRFGRGGGGGRECVTLCTEGVDIARLMTRASVCLCVCALDKWTRLETLVSTECHILTLTHIEFVSVSIVLILKFSCLAYCKIVLVCV